MDWWSFMLEQEGTLQQLLPYMEAIYIHLARLL
jgi:hypothetical protein